MIAFLEGTVVEKLADRVVLAAGGVGYEVLVPALAMSKLPPTGRQARVYTRLQIRDEAMVVYGFASPDERSLFDLLVGVNGVGPKMALAVLSLLTPDAFRKAVATGDLDVLTLVPGVGKKVAGRILLDLRDRVGVGGDGAVTGTLAEVREALMALGLTAQEAREALADLGPNGDRPVEDLLRDALRSVGR